MRGGVQAKTLSQGVTITARSSVLLSDATLAGKTFQGLAINGVANDRDIVATQFFISHEGCYVYLANRASSNQTTGSVVVYYKD